MSMREKACSKLHWLGFALSMVGAGSAALTGHGLWLVALVMLGAYILSVGGNGQRGESEISERNGEVQ